MAADDLDLLRAEAQAFSEFAALQSDPVFFGVGVPRGDGRTVLVVPGLFGNDAYLQPLQIWLRRIGYSPAWSTLFPNAGCPERLSGQLRRALAAQRSDRSRPIAVVGHSRGGMLAWSLAAHLQDQVSHLVLLGSPAGAAVESLRSGGGLTVPPGIARHVGRRGGQAGPAVARPRLRRARVRLPVRRGPPQAAEPRARACCRSTAATTRWSPPQRAASPARRTSRCQGPTPDWSRTVACTATSRASSRAETAVRRP